METLRAPTGRVAWPHTGRPWRRAVRRWRREFSAAVTFAVVLLLPTAFSAFSSSAGNPANSWTGGTVTLTDNDSNDTVKMFDLTLLKPGDTATSCIDVTYSGSLPATVKFFVTDPGTGLDDYVDAVVTRGTISPGTVPSCTGFTADTTNYGLGAGIIYNGELGAIPTTGATGVADPHSATAPEVWATSEEHAYKIQLTVQDDNGGQGLTSEPAFTWQASNTASYASVLGNDTPASYWKLDEAAGATTATDAMGVANGTYTNGPVLGGTSGVRDANTAATFDGVNDYVTFGDVYDYAGTAAMSVEFWVKPATASATYRRLVSKERYVDASNRGGWIAMITGSGDASPQRIQFERRNGTTGVTSIKGATALAAGTWYHVAITYDGTNIRVYVNGASDAAPAASATSVQNHTVPLMLSYQTGYLDGALDEVAIYNSALSAQVIQDHYQLGHK